MARLALLIFGWMALAPCMPAQAQERVALVVGNGAYTGAAALPNPPNDARALGEVLGTLGFETLVAVDSDKADTVRKIAQFARMMRGARVALFYFAGHGIQIGGQNFLLPTDISVESEWSLRYSAIDVQEIVAEMEAEADVAIVILDACRDNPFADLFGTGTRSAAMSRGLGLMNLSGKGAIIAYAAAAGSVASDGSGPHSPYTEALLQEIAAPAVEVGLMFRRVAGRVIDQTRGQQRPELLVRLIDEVYLNQAPEMAAVRVAAAPAAPDAGGSLVRSAGNGASAADDGAETSATDDGETIEVAEATRSAASDRLFGNRLIEPPPWAADLTVPDPTGWTSEPAQAIVEATPAATFGTARELPLAATVETRIAERGQRAWYRIGVPTAGEVRIAVPETPPEIDIFARVWNADIKVAADWQGAARPGGALDGIFPVPAGGDYWIEVSDGNSDGASPQTFTIGVDFAPADDPLEPNPSIGQASPVPADVVLAPTVFPRGDRDWLMFWVDRPGLFSADATSVPANLDIAMRVWNFDGKVVRDWAVPARAGGDTILDAGLAEPGVYFIEVADSNSDAASIEPFQLKLSFSPVVDDMEPNSTFGEAAIVPPSGEHTIAIFPRGDRDWLAFDVDHPGELTMRATEVPENLDVYMRVWTADKAVSRDWFGPLRVGGDVEDFADLALPGRYVLEIADGNSDADSQQSFKLSMNYEPQPDQYEPNDTYADARLLTLGGEILFNILPRGDRDWFEIDAPSAGELTAIIDPSPENLDLHYRVWDADRKVIRDWVAPYRHGGVTEGFADLPRAGTYFLEISDGNSDARSIEHAVLKTVFRPTPDPLEPNDSYGAASRLMPGEPHTAYILPRGDRDWLRLDLDRPGTLHVSVTDVDPALDVVFRLWTEEGKAGSWFSPARAGGPVEATIPIDAPGSYRLELADSNSDARAAAGFTVLATFE